MNLVKHFTLPSCRRSVRQSSRRDRTRKPQTSELRENDIFVFFHYQNDINTLQKMRKEGQDHPIFHGKPLLTPGHTLGCQSAGRGRGGGGQGLLVSGVLPLSIRQSTGQPAQHSSVQATLSIALRLRNLATIMSILAYIFLLAFSPMNLFKNNYNRILHLTLIFSFNIMI